jgi:hypothetical protein
MDEFFASADTSAAGRGDGKVSKLELRNAVRNAPRCPHQSLCARIITLYYRAHARTGRKADDERGRTARVGAGAHSADALHRCGRDR